MTRLTRIAILAALAVTISAGVSSAAQPDPIAQATAEKFAGSDMHMMCKAMNQSDAGLAHVVLDGPYVLATFHCGTQPGWATFKLEGTGRSDKTTVAINGKIDATRLMRIGMDKETANRLIAALKAAAQNK